MASSKLTSGALLRMMKNATVEEPILQVLGSKKIDSNAAEKERYRLLLSDGKYLVSYAMYTSQANDKLIVGGDVAQFTLVKIKRYITSVIQTSNRAGEKNVLVILELEIVKDGNSVGEKLGDPDPLPNDLSQIELEDKENKASGRPQGGNARPSGGSEPPAKRPNLSSMPPTSMDSSFSTDLVLPISSLSPYQNKWVIKARVTNKPQIRTWSNSKGEGKLFSFDILDQSGEMRVTAFNDMVDKYYDFLQVDKVYYISKCQVKMANKRFSSLKNDYEMSISNDSIIQECPDDGSDMPKVQYNFVSFDKITDLEANTLIDVIGVCKQTADVQSLTAKSTGRELKKRDVILVDQSKCSIALTLWGKDAEDFDGDTQIVAVKGARITEFGGGKSLSVPNGAIFKINPDVQESFTLRGWYDNGGCKEEASNISARTGSGSQVTTWMSFKQVQIENLGASERGDYYQTVGTIMFVRHENLMYEACASESCNKKVINMENGKYRCEKCNTETPEFKYRMIGKMNVGDWSGNQWISFFNPECEFIFGATAAEIGEGAKNDPAYIQNLVNQTNFRQFTFKCRVKSETYNDDRRLQTVAVKVEPINYKSYNSQLISQIQQMIG